jgi:hypothetical protein
VNRQKKIEDVARRMPNKHGHFTIIFQKSFAYSLRSDRSMQALYSLAIDPVAETIADPNSYGFRQERSTADAIERALSHEV